jgi:hypothetical protein
LNRASPRRMVDHRTSISRKNACTCAATRALSAAGNADLRPRQSGCAARPRVHPRLTAARACPVIKRTKSKRLGQRA